MRTLQLEINGLMDGRTVFSLLKYELHISGTLIKRMKIEGGIRLSGISVHTNERVKAGQVLTADISSNLPHSQPASELPLDILYEDEDIIAIDKPGGMLVHSNKCTYNEQTVTSVIRAYSSDSVFHPINRLDRGTSGVMLIAKNGYVHTRFKDILHTDEFTRSYIAIVCGRMEKSTGVISLNIGRDANSPLKRVICDDGKPSVTHYEVIAENELFSEVRVTPLTGRTHQIRVHFSAIGHPLVGDFLYGTESSSIKRCALHSYSAEFIHPMTRKRLIIKAALPKDMHLLMGRNF